MIREVHDMLEAMRHIGPRFEAAMHIREADEDEGSQYSHVTAADQAAAVALLRSHVGGTWAELRAGRTQRLQLRAGTRLENPSARVARMAGASAGDAGAGADDSDEGDDDPGEEDDMGADEDETGGPNAGQNTPGPGHGQGPDPTRPSAGEAWDAKVVQYMERCPLR